MSKHAGFISLCFGDILDLAPFGGFQGVGTNTDGFLKGDRIERKKEKEGKNNRTIKFIFLKV